MNLSRELLQALRAYADGACDARITYARLARLGPSVEAAGDAALFELWDHAFALLSEVGLGGNEEDARTEIGALIGATRVRHGAWAVEARTVAAALVDVVVTTNVGRSGPLQVPVVRYNFEQASATA
jgi:hypothetical protein